MGLVLSVCKEHFVTGQVIRKFNIEYRATGAVCTFLPGENVVDADSFLSGICVPSGSRCLMERNFSSIAEIQLARTGEAANSLRVFGSKIPIGKPDARVVMNIEI